MSAVAVASQLVGVTGRGLGGSAATSGKRDRPRGGDVARERVRICVHAREGVVAARWRARESRGLATLAGKGKEEGKTKQQK